MLFFVIILSIVILFIFTFILCAIKLSSNITKEENKKIEE